MNTDALAGLVWCTQWLFFGCFLGCLTCWDEPESRGDVAHVVGARYSPPLVARERGSPGPGATAPTHGPGFVEGWSSGAKKCPRGSGLWSTRSGTHGRKSPVEVGSVWGLMRARLP